MGASGMELKAAVTRAEAWGTPIACGAGSGLLILPHSMKKDRASLVDDSLGLYFANESVSGEIKVEGDLPAYLRYDGLDLLIALAMGATGGAPVQSGETAAYAQSFTLARGLDGLFATFAQLNGVNVDEYPSVKITGFTIKGEVGKPVEITFNTLAINRVTDSQVNTAETFEAVTFFETASRVLYSQGVVRLNAAGGDALGDGDRVYPSSFELTFRRPMAGIYGAGSFDLIDEPSNDGPPEVKLSLNFPRYTSDAFFAAWDADGRKKLDITFTGAEIAEGVPRVFKLSFPNLKIASVDLPIDRGILKHPVAFDCLGCDVAPTGMTGITLPFQIDVVNRMATDVLPEVV